MDGTNLINGIDVTEYLTLARNIASQMTYERPIENTDAYGDALLGLIKAAHRFDPSLEIKFSTYAPKIIRFQIIDSFREREGRRKTYRLDKVEFEGFENIPERAEEQRFCDDDLDSILREIDPRDRLIVTLWTNGERLHKIGERLEISESRVSQLLTAVLKELRPRLEKFYSAYMHRFINLREVRKVKS